LVATKAERNEMRQPDEFQVQASRAMDFLIARKNALIGAVLVIVVLVIGVWAVTEYQHAQDAKAGAELSAALALVARPVMGELGASQPGIETFANDDAKTQALTPAFEKVRADYPGRAAARTAGAQLGFLKLKHNDAAGAVTLLQEYLAKAGSDDVLRTSAQEGLGAAYENQGKLDDAAAAYAKLSEMGASEEGAYQVARIAMLQKKPDAKAQLEKVVADYPKDAAATEARRSLEMIDLPPPPPGTVAPSAPVTAPTPAPTGKKPAVKPAPKPAKKK